MRYHEIINESAATDLAEKLPTLQKYNYDSIDRLMQHVSAKHKMTGEKLHNLFVHKYGHTPDVWIKKLKNHLAEKPIDELEMLDELSLAQMRQELDTNPEFKPFTSNTLQQRPVVQGFAGYEDYEKKKKQKELADKEEMALQMRRPHKPWPRGVSEGNESDTMTDIDHIKDFVKWSIKILHIQKPYPRIRLSRNTLEAQKGHRTGMHKPDENYIWIYIENRNLIDICRTIFHELVHERQGQLGMIKLGDSYPGSPIEAMADMMAGKYIKIYGKRHPEIFQ
jgi:hypothetical protein